MQTDLVKKRLHGVPELVGLGQVKHHDDAEASQGGRCDGRLDKAAQERAAAKLPDMHQIAALGRRRGGGGMSSSEGLQCSECSGAGQREPTRSWPRVLRPNEYSSAMVGLGVSSRRSRKLRISVDLPCWGGNKCVLSGKRRG